MTTIPISPLQIKRHFFSLCTVMANPKGTAAGEVVLEPDVTWEKVPHQPNQWSLVLFVAVKSAKAEAPFLYEAEFQVHGVVEFSGEATEEKKEQVATVNGLGLLYSSVREMMLNITGRSAHGGISLPTINFIQLVADKNAALAGAKAVVAEAPTPVGTSEKVRA